MPEPIPEEMQALLATARSYTVCVLTPGPNYTSDGASDLIWAHGRRNFALRAEGKLVIILRIGGGADIAGIGIFDTTLDDAADIMAGDPAVQAGVLAHHLYTASSFPGDRLPEVPEAVA